MLTNNPSALALHESKLLWPDTPIQCVVSLGTGRYDPIEEGMEAPQYSSLKKKLYQIMISATDTEGKSLYTSNFHGAIIYTVEPLYKEVGYNKTLL